MKTQLLWTALLAALAGCTHHQLNRSTVRVTSTVMDIQYRIVLMNLAKLSCDPDLLPDHIDLADGVVQVNDRLGLGQAGGFTSFTGQYGFGLDQFGPSGQRQVTEQWGADATTDPQRLSDLHDLYRVALGLPPLPPSNAIAYLREQQSEQRGKRSQGEQGNGGDEDGSAGDGSSRGQESLPEPRILPSSLVIAVGGPTSSGGGGSTPSSGGSSGGNSSRRVPIEILLTDVPSPGWFHVGGKHDVPADARYVGNYGDRYAWVTPGGVQALTRFTLTVLNVVKLKPGEGSNSRGVAVTN